MANYYLLLIMKIVVLNTAMPPVASIAMDNRLIHRDISQPLKNTSIYHFTERAAYPYRQRPRLLIPTQTPLPPTLFTATL
jgi:hypothetical protein